MSKKITDLTLLSSADATDVLPLVDISASTTKKTTVQGLVPGMTLYPANMATGLSSSTWAWQSWTPTWTNLTVGNGTYNANNFIQIGKTVFFVVRFTFGTTSTMGTAPDFTLPVTASSRFDFGTLPIGNCWLEDTSVATYTGQVIMSTTTKARVMAQNSAGTYVAENTPTATIPFTWANSDKVSMTGCYEAA